MLDESACNLCTFSMLFSKEKLLVEYITIACVLSLLVSMLFQSNISVNCQQGLIWSKKLTITVAESKMM